MLQAVPLFQCLGKAVRKHGLRALANLVPMGDVLFDIAKDAWDEYQHADPGADARAALEPLARMTNLDAQQAAHQVVQQVAADQPPEVRQQLAAYLSQVPATIRQSLRRPTDPTGTTIPAGLSLQRPEDLLPLLPSRLPRFQPGDRPLPGSDWVLVEPLGVGGFGEVWKAHNPHLGETVALKFCLDPRAAAVLRNEAEMLRRVRSQGKHPGIVPLLDTYLSADPPCLKYEYVAGGDLGGWLHERHTRPGSLSPRLAAQVMQHLARIVAFAHQLNPPIVHRDLKPANILVQPAQDGKVSFRIADFGIGGVAASQLLEQSSRGVSQGDFLATAARGAYTPLYASPQQIEGGLPDPRDDMHALGVIWYQLLTGDVLKGVPADWREVLQERGVSADQLQLLASCLASRAERRLAHAAVLAEQLTALLTTESSSKGDASQTPVQAVTPVAPGASPVGPPAAAWRRFARKAEGLIGR